MTVETCMSIVISNSYRNTAESMVKSAITPLRSDNKTLRNKRMGIFVVSLLIPSQS